MRLCSAQCFVAHTYRKDCCPKGSSCVSYLIWLRKNFTTFIKRKREGKKKKKFLCTWVATQLIVFNDMTHLPKKRKKEKTGGIRLVSFWKNKHHSLSIVLPEGVFSLISFGLCKEWYFLVLSQKKKRKKEWYFISLCVKYDSSQLSDNQMKYSLIVWISDICERPVRLKGLIIIHLVIFVNWILLLIFLQRELWYLSGSLFYMIFPHVHLHIYWFFLCNFVHSVKNKK